MTKIAIFGDTHFSVRSDSYAFHANFKEFYSNIFFPYLKKHNITEVFQTGDLFDRRKYINFNSLALCRKYFFDVLKKENIQFYTLLGNHDVYFKNTLEVNSPSLLLKEYDNITIFDTPTTWKYGIDIIPWICADNEQATMDLISKSTSPLCIGHFEISGFEMDRGNVCYTGMDHNILKNYKKVLSGHFHHKSSQGNITYVGTPSEHTWADYNDEKGFHIFDTDDYSLTFIKNPYRMFYKIKYDDTKLSYNDIMNAKYSNIEDKHIKIIVDNRSDPFKFDTFLDCLSKHNPLELSVVENFIDYSDNGINTDDIDQEEDTLTILSKYVDGLTLPVKTETIKSIIRGIYNEAMVMGAE